MEVPPFGSLNDVREGGETKTARGNWGIEKSGTSLVGLAEWDLKLFIVF